MQLRGNAALMASQWQDRAWTVFLQPPIDAAHKVGQAAGTAFEVFGTTRPELNQAYQLWWHD